MTQGPVYLLRVENNRKKSERMDGRKKDREVFLHPGEQQEL